MNQQQHKQYNGSIIHPFSMGVFGSRNSGKTVFTINLLLSDIISPPLNKVIYIYKTWQPIFEKLQKQNKFQIEFLTEIPDFSSYEKNENKCFILDDFMVECGESPIIQNLFTQGRHENLSVVFLSQNLFHQGKYVRDISLNIEYFVLFKNVRDKMQIKTLAKQMYPTKSNLFLDVYINATNLPHSYLFIDMRQSTPESIRLRGDILNGSKNIIVYVLK